MRVVLHLSRCLVSLVCWCQVVYDPEQKQALPNATTLAKDSKSAGGPLKVEPMLVEIGPRFLLNPIRIFEYTFVSQFVPFATAHQILFCLQWQLWWRHLVGKCKLHLS